jgi:hypothetical protein
MNINTLNEFRHASYTCFKQARDALFNLVDALSSETTAHSFPELSLSPFFQRKWASAYEALEDGKIEQSHLREVFIQFAPLPGAGQRVFLGVDTSNLLRPAAQTSADRTLVPLANLPEKAHVVCPGWVISSVVLLPEQVGQGTFVLDTQRVLSTGLATQVAASQLQAVVDLLVKRGLHPVIIGDRWYACAPFLARMTDVAASCLLRVKSNRVFYHRAPARQPGQRGASRKDGARFQCSDASTHGEPDASWQGTDANGKRVEVRGFNQVHLRSARWVEVSVIQVIRHGASERPRDPKMSWFVWKGYENEAAPLAEISPTYRLRYSHEHGYRLDKQVLLWDKPRLRTPQQTERWTQIVACAHNQLVLARPLVAGIYRPWETRRSVLTLAQVRRAMPTILTQLGTPARPPQPRGKAPGRAKGFHPKPAPRHPVIRKTSKKEKKRKPAPST